MISSIKLQLNLYSHREKDNAIINNLGLNNAENPNNKARELLYSLATGQTVQPLNTDTSNYLTKISELEKIIESLNNEKIMLQAENNVLKSQLYAQSSITQNNVAAPIEATNQNATTSCSNKKLQNSIRKLEI